MSESKRKIGLATAVIIGINAMIGAGIFALPAVLATNVGPAGILAFIFVVFSVWFIAQSLAHVAKKFPQEGSFYLYVKQWAGHTMGIITSGSYIVGLLIGMGLLTQVAGNFATTFFPNMSAKLLGVTILTSLVIINLMGIYMSQLGQKILIFCTVIPILAIIIMSLTNADPILLTPFAPYGFVNVLKATKIVIFGFFGFECATSLFNIVKNPERNVPKALTYSILFVGTLYTLFISAIIVSTPLELFATNSLAEVLKIMFPNHSWIITIINISMLSAILGTIHSMLWASSNLMTSLFKNMKNKYIQNLLAKNILNKKSAIIITGVGILTTFLTIQKQDLFFSFAAIFVVFTYIMSIITLLFSKEDWKSGQNIKTILGLVTASMIFIFALQGLIIELQKIL